eukprot:NODE_246_length_12992_cov_0.264407.p11 type:complete len:157 gc:universal NODE_246_length_12992_cov_0.264407:10007-9537(-)
MMNPQNPDNYKSLVTGHQYIWLATYIIQQEIIHIDEPVDDGTLESVMLPFIERIRALNSNDTILKILISFSRAHICGSGFVYCLGLCQTYEKACFQVKHCPYAELFKCAKDRGLLSLVGSQRIFVSTDWKSNLYAKNLYYHLTMEKDRNYWRKMAE